MYNPIYDHCQKFHTSVSDCKKLIESGIKKDLAKGFLVTDDINHYMRTYTFHMPKDGIVSKTAKEYLYPAFDLFTLLEMIPSDFVYNEEDYDVIIYPYGEIIITKDKEDIHNIKNHLHNFSSVSLIANLVDCICYLVKLKVIDEAYLEKSYKKVIPISEKTIRIYSGEMLSREDTEGHPVENVKYAEKLVEEFKVSDEEVLNCYSNSIDFISTLYYLGKGFGFMVQTYKDDVACSIHELIEGLTEGFKVFEKVLAKNNISREEIDKNN